MTIKNFKNFLNEEIRINNAPTDFINLLANKKNNKVAQFLAQLLQIDYNGQVDFIDIGKELGELTFIASNKADYDNTDSNYLSNRRQSIRIGRLVRKIIEDFKGYAAEYDGEFYCTNDKILLDIKNIHNDFIQKINIIRKLNDDAPLELSVLAEGIERSDFIFHYISTSYNYKNLYDRCFVIYVNDDYETKEFKKYTGKIKAELKVDLSDSDIEKFVNEFVAIRKSLSLEDLGVEFKIVSGPEIATNYYYKNYYGYEEGLKIGILWNSCMRYERCQKYFDMYVDNPNQVRMLILKTKDDKVMGRALLWKLDTSSWGLDSDEDIYFLDRIYCINDSDERLFVNHAIENNWVYKDKGRVCLNNETMTRKLYVTLENEVDTFFPYLDTIKYYDSDSGVLTNDYNQSYTHELDDTMGAYDGADDDDRDVDYGDDNDD